MFGDELSDDVIDALTDAAAEKIRERLSNYDNEIVLLEDDLRRLRKARRGIVEAVEDKRWYKLTGADVISPDEADCLSSYEPDDVSFMIPDYDPA